MSKIITIDPKVITKLSPVSGCGKSRRMRINDYHYHLKGIYLSGDWDLTKRLVIRTKCYEDFLLFKQGLKCKYPWGRLYNHMKIYGYIQNPKLRYVEVGIGRDGEILLADGRHRLVCAWDLKITQIPVEIVYEHASRIA